MSFVAFLEVRIEQFTRAINQAQARLDQFADTTGKKLGKIGENFDKVGKSLTIGVTVPLTALGVAAVKTFGDLQALKMGLEAVMGSANAANAEFEKLKEVAKLPGLGLKEAVQGSVSLQSAGFSADQARRSLMAFGNALATVGKGAHELALVNLALTQLQNKTSGFGQDLRQLTEQLPQLRGAMVEAFGTSDSEQIAKLGFTGAQVVTKLTAEFEKLPKVTGGINNAFENVRDAVTVSLSRIGEAINKNFDIEGKLAKLGEFLDKITTKFESLNPETQKVILLFGGVAAAIGPVLVGIGALLQLAPLVGTAFAVMTGPIGLVVAAVVLAVAAIIKYWDQIKDYFTSGQGGAFWNGIKENAIKLWESLKSIFNTIKTFILDIWGRVGKSVLGTVSSVFETILAVIKGVFANITNIIAGFAAFLRGDFRGMFDAFKNLWKEFWKGIAIALLSVIKTLGNALSGFFRLIGAKSFADHLQKKSDAIALLGPNIDKVTESVKALDVALPKASKKAGDAGKPIGELSDKAKKLAEEIANLKLELQGVLMSEWGRQLFDINNKYDAIVKKYGGNKDILNLASQARNAELFRAKMEQITEEIGKQQKSNLGGVNPSMNFTLPTIKTGDLNIDVYAKGLDEMVERIKNTKDAIEDILSKGLVTVISNSMSALGEALATGGNILGAIGNTLISTLGGLAKSIGEQLIAFGTAGIALKFMVANPFLALAAGAALVALGSFAASAVGNSVNNVGAGGYSSGSSGRFSDTNFNNFRGAFYNNDRQVIDLRIKGDDLVGSVNINNNRNNRLS